MMGVLIKDMLMPKDCVFCPMAHWNKLDEITGCEITIGKKYVDKTDRDFWYGDGRPKWCPLEAERTGHWIPKNYVEYFSGDCASSFARAYTYECSECGTECPKQSKVCWECGARMKGEEDVSESY